MSAQPIPKPEKRIVDPQLLRDLKPIWREYGCALCGRSVTDEVEPGFDIELAHVEARGRGGDDATENILGMCGELAGCKGHPRYDRHRIALKWNEQGQLVWISTEPGGSVWQPVRIPPQLAESFLPDSTQVPSDASSEPQSSVEPESETASDRVPVTDAADPLDGGVTSAGVAIPAASAPSPDDPPDVRAAQIRDRVTGSKRLMMEAAILLRHAYERQDFQALGVSWTDYYTSIGLERSNVSKMLQAARVLGGHWQELTPAAREHVSIEQLYQASRLVTETGWTPEAAIDAAASNPTSRLIALRTGDEPAAKCRCTCPQCGRELYHERGQ